VTARIHTAISCAVLVLALSVLTGADPAKPAPKFKGTAEAFVMEVLADPPGAAKKYSGQVIEVEGTVAAPGKFTPKGCFVVTGATGKFTTKSTDLICTPAKGVTVPTAGQRVKVVGTAGPSINVSSVDVEGCTVEVLKAKP
jgi:hypothetical protein